MATRTIDIPGWTGMSSYELENRIITLLRNIDDSVCLRFQNTEGTNSKWWAIDLVRITKTHPGNANDMYGNYTMTTRWGKLGKAGQSTTKGFTAYYLAISAFRKLIQTKQSKGYVQVATPVDITFIPPAPPTADEMKERGLRSRLRLF